MSSVPITETIDPATGKARPLTDEERRVRSEALRRALDDTLGEIQLLHEGLQLVRERIERSTRLDEQLAPLLNEMRAVKGHSALRPLRNRRARSGELGP